MKCPLDAHASGLRQLQRFGNPLLRDVGGDYSMSQFRKKHRVAALAIRGHEHVRARGNVVRVVRQESRGVGTEDVGLTLT